MDHRSHVSSPKARDWPTPSKGVLAKPQRADGEYHCASKQTQIFRYRTVLTGSRRVGQLHSADGPTFQLEQIAVTVCGKLQNDCREPQAGCIAGAAREVSVDCGPSPVEDLSEFLERIGIVGDAAAKRCVVHDGTPIRALTEEWRLIARRSRRALRHPHNFRKLELCHWPISGVAAGAGCCVAESCLVGRLCMEREAPRVDVALG